MQSGLKSERLLSEPPACKYLLMYARYSKRAKTCRERQLLICILAFFLAITFERKVFSKIHALKMKESLNECRTYHT